MPIILLTFLLKLEAVLAYKFFCASVDLTIKIKNETREESEDIYGLDEMIGWRKKATNFTCTIALGKILEAFKIARYLEKSRVVGNAEILIGHLKKVINNGTRNKQFLCNATHR